MRNRLLVFGNLFVWDALLRPEETLTALLNAAQLRPCDSWAKKSDFAP